MTIYDKYKKSKDIKKQYAISFYTIKTSLGAIAGLISISGCCSSVYPGFAIVIGSIGSVFF